MYGYDGSSLQCMDMIRLLLCLYLFLWLTHRHEKFVGVATDVHKTRGDPQAPPVPLLLPPPSLFSSPFTLTSPDQLHSTLTEAESLINQSNPSHALTLCEELIQSSSEDQESDLAQAWLHLMAGRAVVEDVALTRPVLLEDLWGEAAGSSRRRNKGRGGGRRGVKVLGWLSLVPESFQKALGHFCTALQLCHPASPPQPLREVYTYVNPSSCLTVERMKEEEKRRRENRTKAGLIIQIFIALRSPLSPLVYRSTDG